MTQWKVWHIENNIQKFRLQTTNCYIHFIQNLNSHSWCYSKYQIRKGEWFNCDAKYRNQVRKISEYFNYCFFYFQFQRYIFKINLIENVVVSYFCTWCEGEGNNQYYFIDYIMEFLDIFAEKLKPNTFLSSSTGVDLTKLSRWHRYGGNWSIYAIANGKRGRGFDHTNHSNYGMHICLHQNE